MCADVSHSLTKEKCLCCLLHVACCMLPVAYCLLPVAYCILPIAHCMLHVAYAEPQGAISATCVYVYPATAYPHTDRHPSPHTGTRTEQPPPQRSPGADIVNHASVVAVAVVGGGAAAASGAGTGCAAATTSCDATTSCAAFSAGRSSSTEARLALPLELLLVLQLPRAASSSDELTPSSAAACISRIYSLSAYAISRPTRCRLTGTSSSW
jgi:hypothetical protein